MAELPRQSDGEPSTFEQVKAAYPPFEEMAAAAESAARDLAGDSQSYSVIVLGAGCEHRWPGTVSLISPQTFALDVDDGSCPECGGNAGMILFGEDDVDG
jgi:hypothetical protein